jgi:hypothetical protein
LAHKRLKQGSLLVTTKKVKSVYIFKRGDIYYFRAVVNNKEIRLSLHTSSKRQAGIKAKELIGRLYIMKEMSFASNDAYTGYIMDECYRYIDRATKEYSDLEDKRFQRLKKFDKQTISEKLHGYADIIYDISQRDKLKKEAIRVAKDDEQLKSIYDRLETDKERIQFFELVLKAEKEVLKTDLERAEDFKDTSKTILE